MVYAAYLRSHFSVSQPKALRSRARGYLTELRRATCSVESHSSFCSPFSPAEFLAAASNLSSSTATGPDKVAYPMLKHLPRSGMDFLLHIFNLSWSSHSFPSIWKTSSIIPIHKMGKPLDSPASFRPISLTSCVSKLFERIILSRLLFFLESNSILSPRQAGFCPGRSTLDQILYLSQSISDGFNKPRPGSRTILSTIDFSKAFDSVWHPALFHKLISAGLPPCFARWTQSFLSDWRASVVFQNHKSRSFRVRRGVPQGSVLGPVLFSPFINDLPASLPSSVSFSLYADDLAIWSSSPSVPTAVEATQGALFRLERWSEYWCLPLNPSKCEASFFSVDPHQANLQPNLLLLGSRLRFNPTPIFLGVTFDRTLSFSKHVSSLKAGVLANCSLCGTEATLSFSAGPVCSSFSAEACAILHALCWSRQHHKVCHFSSLLLLSDSRFVLATLSSPPPFLLSQTLWQIWRNCPSSHPVLSDYNGSPDTRFSRGTTQLMSLPDGERCLRPPQSLVVSLLLSLVSTLVLSRTGGVLSLQSILTHRFPQFPLRNLCSLVMLAVSSLVFAATDTAFF